MNDDAAQMDRDGILGRTAEDIQRVAAADTENASVDTSSAPSAEGQEEDVLLSSDMKEARNGRSARLHGYGLWAALGGSLAVAAIVVFRLQVHQKPVPESIRQRRRLWPSTSATIEVVPPSPSFSQRLSRAWTPQTAEVVETDTRRNTLFRQPWKGKALADSREKEQGRQQRRVMGVPRRHRTP
jgi:hypothetical protein